jgi:hypothetical protein
MNATILTGVSGLILASVLGCTAANAASASTPAPQKKDMFAVLADTKITLDEAIQTAEHTVTGQLLKAGLDSDNNAIVYKIAIADSNTRTITALTIDTVTGKVLNSKTFHADQQVEKTSRKPGAAKAAPAPQATSPKAEAAPASTPATTPSTPTTKP